MVPYCVHGRPALDLIISQMYSVYILAPYLFKIHFKDYLPFYAKISKVFSYIQVLQLKFFMHFALTAYILHANHPILHFCHPSIW